MKKKFFTEVHDKDIIPFLVYTNNLADVLEIKEEYEEAGLKDILLIPLTPVVGCHAGPGTMGVGYVERRK